MRIEYLASFILTFLLIGGFFFGGVFWDILELIFVAMLLYIIYKAARRFKGDVVLNFFSIIYFLSAILNFVIILALGLSGDMRILFLNSFIFATAIVLKFLQERKILTVMLVIHTLTIFSFMASGTNNVDTFVGSLIRILINVALIMYVNILREFLKEVEQSREPLFSPEAWEKQREP